jgi:hypothetical protein
MRSAETDASRNGRSLIEAAQAWITLERLDDRLAVGDCPLPGCEGPAGSFTIFRNHRSEETFECGSCQRAGDLRDFEELMSSPDGAELLHRLAAYVRRYVVLSDEQALLLALWTLHTHALDAADTTPYLNIKSAEKRSGKTRLLEVLSLVVSRPWLTGRVTAAVLVRKTSAEQPTLLLDESDAAFKADREYAEALRGILNTGFRRGGVTSLCVGQGANLTYKDFPVFCPKAIAGIGRLPDTVADRSIPIELRRRRATEKVERFRLRKAAAGALELQRGAAAWAEAHVVDLNGREPDLPDELDDRAQDIIEPLLAIADTVGGEWPEMARRAARALLTGEEREDSESLGVRLLRDVRDVFDKEKVEQLRTSTLLETLCALDEAPWGSLRGEPLDARGLARILRPYGAKSGTLREGEATFKGYRRASFEDAWARYVLDEGPEEAKHPSHPSHPANRAESSVPDNAEHTADTEHENPHKKGDVTDVTHVTGNPGITPGPQIVRLLREPPGWLARQLALCREDRERHLRSTCSAIAIEVYGTAARAEEVEPVLAAHLEEGA